MFLKQRILTTSGDNLLSVLFQIFSKFGEHVHILCQQFFLPVNEL